MTNQTEIPADVLARVADAIADGFYEDEHSEVIARAALTAAGWAELFKSRNDTLAELIARIAECERLQDERNEARAALAFLMTDADGFSGVDADRHELAVEVAIERGRDEPTPEDELDGFLRLIELARQAAGGEGV